VSELQARGPAAQNQVFRVSGNLVPGTLARDSSGLGIQFLIADPGAASAASPLPVVYRGGQVPAIIGDNIEIVAEGKLDAHGTFTASNVLAKCPSKLENAPPEEHDYQ
jgi:cytochrome c-type biogenesis protein CcmE